MNVEAQRGWAAVLTWWTEYVSSQGWRFALIKHHLRGVNLGESCCGLFESDEAAVAHFLAEEAPDRFCYTVTTSIVNGIITLASHWTTDGVDSRPFTVWQVIPADSPQVLRLLVSSDASANTALN